LFENIQKLKNYELTFAANIHGVDLNGTGENTNNHTDKAEPAVPLFGDPEDYKHLSEDEREAITAKMIGKHKNWSNGGILNHG